MMGPAHLTRFNWYEPHQVWLAGQPDGERADLEGANLEGADLRGANFEDAILRGANLWCTSLASANLSRTNLKSANLEGANLRGACLEGANLEGANLEGANLRGACLEGANLRRANLRHADFKAANLAGTCLDPAAPVPPCVDAQLAAANLELRRVKGRDRVYGWRTRRSLHVGTHEYTPGRWHHANALSLDRAIHCHPGIYFGGLENADRDDLVQVWAYRDELVFVNATKGCRARRVWALKETS